MFESGNPSHLRLAEDLRASIRRIHALGVVHDDLKEENIMVEAPSMRPVIIDFGLAECTTDKELLLNDSDELRGILYRSAKVRAYSLLPCTCSFLCMGSLRADWNLPSACTAPL